MQKTLKIRYSTETKTGIVSKALTIEVDTNDELISNMNSFISWIVATNRGAFNENGDFDCKSKNDYIGCQKKALALGLLPKLSVTEIRARSCAVS